MTKPEPTLDHLLAAIRVTSATPRLDWADTPEPLHGGFWAQIWKIRLIGAPPDMSGDLVARVMPDAAIAERETLVQANLARAGFATPTVRLAAGPGDDLDHAWMLMDFVSGQPMLDDLSGPSALLRLPQIAREMPDRLARHTAQLHRIDPHELTQKLGSIDDTAERLAGLIDWNRELGRTDLASLGQWLQRHRPADDTVVICHGDLHPFNVLTGPDGDTVLDWSNAGLIHRAYDLAFTNLLLRHPPLVAPPPVRPVLNLAGMFLGRRFLRSYAKQSDSTIDSDQLEWFTLLHALRILTDVATWKAGNNLGDHAGHPFLLLRRPLIAHVATATDIDLDR